MRLVIIDNKFMYQIKHCCAGINQYAYYNDECECDITEK